MDIRVTDNGISGAPAQNSVSSDKPAPKPFLGINFKCCSIYSRIYKNRTGDAYEGACPKCMKRIKLPIGEGGTSNRFFDAQ